MAGSSSLTPKPVSPSRPTKRFTLEEANSALALVKRIAADVVKTHQAVLSLRADANAAGPKDQAAKEAQLNRAVDRFQGYVSELRAIGCELKDAKLGLVDFLCRFQGRDIYLCWKLGEDQIDFWHEVSAGFGDRQPVAALRA
jgi:hypothetical protein